MAANPDSTYTGKLPPTCCWPSRCSRSSSTPTAACAASTCCARPRHAPKDTVQIAIDAVRRAAPLGDVSRLPRPWKFTETFLFDDDRQASSRAR